jgi:hypothetical protein
MNPHHITAAEAAAAGIDLSRTPEEIRRELENHCNRWIEKARARIDLNILPAIAAGDTIGPATVENLIRSQSEITVYRQIMANRDRLPEWVSDAEDLILSNRLPANRSTCQISNAWEAQQRATLCEALAQVKNILKKR